MKIDMNDIFDSYDLFGRRNEIVKNIYTKYPQISDDEVKHIMNYLGELYDFCTGYGQFIADKYKVPGLPKTDNALIDINLYLKICKEKYPEIHDDKILGIFSTVCWLSNR